LGAAARPLAGPWDMRGAGQAATVAALGAHLEALPRRLALLPGRSVLVIEDCRGRYVQVATSEGRLLVAEAVSNNFLRGEARWGPPKKKGYGAAAGGPRPH
jgi:hypothetical protein